MFRVTDRERRKFAQLVRKCAHDGREGVRLGGIERRAEKNRLEHSDRFRFDERTKRVLRLTGLVFTDGELDERRDDAGGVVIVALAALAQQVFETVPSKRAILEEQFRERFPKLRTRVREQTSRHVRVRLGEHLKLWIRGERQAFEHSQ